MTAQHTPGQCLSSQCRRRATEILSGDLKILCGPCKHAFDRGVKSGIRQSVAPEIAQLRKDKAELLEVLKSSELIVAREAERIAEAHRNAGHPRSLNVTALVLEKIQAAIAKATP